MNNAAGLRARPREEKSFSKRERLKLNFISFCEVIFVNIPKDNQCLRFRLLTFTTSWKYYEENSLVGCHVAFRKTDSSRHADLVVGAEWQPMQHFR